MSARQRRHAVAISGTHAANADFDTMAAAIREFRKQPTQRASRESVSVWVRQHHLRIGRMQATDRLRQRGPLHRDVARSILTQPAIKGRLRSIDHACPHQSARDVHARGGRFGGEQFADQIGHGQAGPALQALADGGNTLATVLQHVSHLPPQRRRIGAHIETDDVDALASPAAGHFNAGDELQSQRLRGGRGTRAACQGVMIGQREQLHAQRSRMLHQCLRAQHAIGAGTMSVKIETQSRRIIADIMTNTAAARVDWSAIDTVFLDLDGTLLDLAFDNYVWLGRIPELYAEQQGLSVPEAQAALAPKFRRWEHQLEWYSIDFWSQELGLDVLQIHRDAAGRVGWLPGAQDFLRGVRTLGKRLVLMTNSHPSILAIKDQRTGVLDYLDAAFSSAQFGAPKEDPAFWRAAASAEPHVPARTLFCDDSAAVLRAATQAGIGHVRAVRHADSSRQPHRHEEFAAIDGIVDLLHS